MIPDVRTMWMVVGTTALLFGCLEIWAGSGKRRDPAMVLWGCANFAAGLGAGLLSTQGMLPYVVSEVAANGFLVLCWALIWAGVRAFAGQSVPWPVVFAGPLMVVVACLVIPPFPTHMVMRIHLTSLGIVTYLMLMAIDALRAERAERLVMRRVLAVLGIVSTFPVIWRTVNAQLSGVGFDLMGNTASTALPLVVLFITAVAINVCLLLVGRERLGNELARAAATDGLTGTLNRSGFLAQARQTAEVCGRCHRPCSVVVIDLDEFKSVNDRYGHAVGDRLLAGFADIARTQIRAGDVLGRTGGEEFCALLAGASERRALDIAERVRRTFAGSTIEHPGGSVTGTVSIGVAQLGAEEDLSDAIRRADMAMYDAKKEGRDRVNRAT